MNLSLFLWRSTAIGNDAPDALFVQLSQGDR